MTPKENIVAASKNEDIQILTNIITLKRIRHIQIFRGMELTGIISIGDVVKIYLNKKITRSKLWLITLQKNIQCRGSMFSKI